MIKKGNFEYNDMMKKLDIFLLSDRLTQEQYTELTKMMDEQQNAE